MKMNRTNTAGRILALLLTALMVLSLAACGTNGGDKMDGMSSEPKNAEEAVAMHKELMAQENDILSENTALWEKVFMAADKGMTMQEDGKNYGEFLLDTIEGSKDQCIDCNKGGKPCKRNRAELVNLAECDKQIGKSKQKSGSCRIIVALYQAHEIDKDRQASGQQIHHCRRFAIDFVQRTHAVVDQYNSHK